MKVKVIYDFSVDLEVTDFDKVQIEMKWEDFQRIRKAVRKAWLYSELEIERFYFKDLYTKLNNYETSYED